MRRLRNPGRRERAVVCFLAVPSGGDGCGMLCRDDNPESATGTGSGSLGCGFASAAAALSNTSMPF